MRPKTHQRHQWSFQLNNIHSVCLYRSLSRRLRRHEHANPRYYQQPHREGTFTDFHQLHYHIRHPYLGPADSSVCVYVCVCLQSPQTWHTSVGLPFRRIEGTVRNTPRQTQFLFRTVLHPQCTKTLTQRFHRLCALRWSNGTRSVRVLKLIYNFFWAFLD